MARNTAKLAKAAAEAAAALAAQTLQAALETAEGAALCATLDMAAARLVGPPSEPKARTFGPSADAYAAHPLTRRREAGGGAAKTADEKVPHVASTKRRLDTIGKVMGVDRKYKVLMGHKARAGTYRAHMLDVILAHTSTHAAIAAYCANPWPDLRPLCNTHTFNWAKREGYIAFVD